MREIHARFEVVPDDSKLVLIRDSRSIIVQLVFEIRIDELGAVHDIV